MAYNERDALVRGLIVLTLVVMGFTSLSILSGGMMGGGMMGGGMMGGGLMGGWLFMLLPIILIIFLISALQGRDRGPHNRSRQYGVYNSETPYQILDRRYANGDLSLEEYIKIKEEFYKR